MRAHWVAAPLLVLLSNAVQSLELTPPAYQLAARLEGVPAHILYVLGVQESGIRLGEGLRPWPWTLNIAGTAHHFASRAQTCSALHRALKRWPATAIDVGLGQINVGFHAHRVREPCALVDPYRNLALAARILREQHTPGENWLIAIGRYHRPAGGAPAVRYRERVRAHLVRLLGPSIAHAILQGSAP